MNKGIGPELETQRILFKRLNSVFLSMQKEGIFICVCVYIYMCIFFLPFDIFIYLVSNRV